MFGSFASYLGRHHIGMLALFIALSGTAYAATLPRNSVSSKHIKNGQVKGVDLGKASVDSSKVANGKLLGEDFAAGQLPAGARGPQGAQGAQGLRGEPGTAGTPGSDGTALQAQARCDGCPVESGAADVGVAVPLMDAEWTQGADEANAMWIEVTWSSPPLGCTASPFPGGRVRVLLDGEEIFRTEFGPGSPTVTTGTWFHYEFAPGADTPRVLTAMVGDNCTGSENAKVEEIKVDVASVHG